MSDTHSPETDELVSAYIDGALSPDEAARVEADPALLARAAELQAVARAVGASPPSPTTAVREAAVSRAMNEAASLLPLPAEQPAVDELARSGPSRWKQLRGRRALSIAAAVLLVLLGVSLLATQLTDGDGGDLTAARQSTTLLSRDGDDTSGPEAATAAARGAGAEPAADRYDLGRVDSASELVARVRLHLDGGGGAADSRSLEATADATNDGRGCEDRLRRADPTLGPTVWSGTAVYREISVHVYAFEGVEAPSRTVVATSRERDCEVLIRREL